MPLKFLLAAVFVVASCEHAVGLAGLQEDAACTAANLSTTQSEIREEDVRGEIGGEMNFFCCQRQGGSACEFVSMAEYYFNDIPINTSDTAKYNTRNEGGAQLIVMYLAPADQGKYTCACPDTRSPPVEDSGIVLLCESRTHTRLCTRAPACECMGGEAEEGRGGADRNVLIVACTLVV